MHHDQGKRTIALPTAAASRGRTQKLEYASPQQNWNLVPQMPERGAGGGGGRSYISAYDLEEPMGRKLKQAFGLFVCLLGFLPCQAARGNPRSPCFVLTCLCPVALSWHVFLPPPRANRSTSSAVGMISVNCSQRNTVHKRQPQGQWKSGYARPVDPHGRRGRQRGEHSRRLINLSEELYSANFLGSTS